jgi:hypothetical protein
MDAHEQGAAAPCTSRAAFMSVRYDRTMLSGGVAPSCSSRSACAASSAPPWPINSRYRRDFAARSAIWESPSTGKCVRLAAKRANRSTSARRPQSAPLGLVRPSVRAARLSRTRYGGSDPPGNGLQCTRDGSRSRSSPEARLPSGNLTLRARDMGQTNVCL